MSSPNPTLLQILRMLYDKMTKMTLTSKTDFKGTKTAGRNWLREKRK
jgi:hypothetical protein